MCIAPRGLHRTNKIEGSFRAVTTLKYIFKNNLVFYLYRKLDGLASTELEYKASLFTETCTESITVIQHFMLQKRVNWVTKWSLIEEEYLQPKTMRTKATELQTLASDQCQNNEHISRKSTSKTKTWSPSAGDWCRLWNRIIYSPEQV